MATEYRLIVERPGYQDGRRDRVYPKRDYEHARQSLTDWYQDSERYRLAGLDPWQAKIQEREVSDWTDIEFAEGVPV